MNWQEYKYSLPTVLTKRLNRQWRRLPRRLTRRSRASRTKTFWHSRRLEKYYCSETTSAKSPYLSTPSEKRPFICVPETGAGPKRLWAVVLNTSSLDNIRHRYILYMCRDSDTKSEVSGTITNHLRESGARTRLNQGIVGGLIVPVLLGRRISSSLSSWYNRSNEKSSLTTPASVSSSATRG